MLFLDFVFCGCFGFVVLISGISCWWRYVFLVFGACLLVCLSWLFDVW